MIHYLVRFFTSLGQFFSVSARGRGQDETVDFEFACTDINHNQVFVSETFQVYNRIHPWRTGIFENKAYCRVDVTVEETTISSNDDSSLELYSSFVCSTYPSSSFTSDAASLSSFGSLVSSIITDGELNSHDEISTVSPVDAIDISSSVSPCYLSGSNLSNTELDINEHLQPQHYLDLQGDRELNKKKEEQEVDSVYYQYEESMKWLDVLILDRLHGLDAIRNKRFSADSWSKMAIEKLEKSLKSDLELAFVAQSCLSWEALHHQYWKVKAIANSHHSKRELHKNVADGFQKFQILLERFMEDDAHSSGKRICRGRK